jgi:assimilatory nitrate reductase catalytic subunit
VDFAQRLEQRLRPGQPSLFAFSDPAQVFDEYKVLTRDRDLDLSGISHALLDQIGPQQWPFPGGALNGTPRLYVDGIFPTATGRAHFVADPYRAAKEQRDARFPLTLITGRLRDQWHGMSRTGTAAQLFGHVSEAVLSLHPDELRRHRLQSGDLVSLKSRRGNVIVAVGSDDSVRPGQAFLPMHWGDRFLKGGINTVTQPAFDPLSKQPELKHSGVRIEPVQLPWHLFALIEGDVQQHFEALRPLCEGFTYASLSLTGRERPALLIRAASAQAPDPQLLRDIDQLLGLNDGPVLAYDDPRRSIGKRVRIENGRITAIRLAGETIARHWLQSLWLEGSADEQLRRWLLAPLSAPPGNAASLASSSKTLCNCKNVSESAVCAGIRRGLDLSGLKQELGCGTQCGSCVPEIKRLLAVTAQPMAITS